jgi:hypothetical protein
MPSPINTPTNERLPSHLWTIRSQSQTLNGLPFTKPSINSDIDISLETDSLRAQDTDMEQNTNANRDLRPNSETQLNIGSINDQINNTTQLSTTGMSFEPFIFLIFSPVNQNWFHLKPLFRISF